MLQKLTTFQKIVAVIVGLGFLTVLTGNILSANSMPQFGRSIRLAGLGIALVGLVAYAVEKFVKSTRRLRASRMAIAPTGRNEGKVLFLHCFSIGLIIMGVIYSIVCLGNTFVLFGSNNGSAAGYLFFFWPLLSSVGMGATMVAMGLVLWMVTSIHQRLLNDARKEEH